MTLNAIRIARPVTDLSLSSHMYCTGLGLEQIAQFADHDGFCGVMVGRSDLGWHLKFTLCHHHSVAPSPGTSVLFYAFCEFLYVFDLTGWGKSLSAMF
ncbi:VOC family protein [Klebsiella michiganensis]|uniref:VOC family protein n=1 Tax=Klebsiella michiganensis TaxID=1134687 RepID=UPI001D0E4A71